MAFCARVVPSSGDAQERLAKIQRTHLGYLRLDENSDKLRTRKVLEDLIASHLSTVPHKEKFPCPKFLDIISRSIEDNDDFNASKASRAFDALEKYAVNLLCQPWRQEYHCIRLYGGFYQHRVEMHLRNAREVLYLMGYEPFAKMEVCLSEPIDPDKVVDVSLNCLIAAVECQIMMQIMERVGGEFSWRNVGYVRRHNVCDVAKAAHILTMKTDRKGRTFASGHDRGRNAADTRSRIPLQHNGYVRVEKLVDVPCAWSDGVDVVEADQKYPAGAYASIWERKSAANGHSPDGAAFQPRTLDEHIAASRSLVDDSSWASRAKPPSQTRDDCWGFVEQTLERKGYKKDHGERGDLLEGFSPYDVGVSRDGRPIDRRLGYDVPPDESKPSTKTAFPPAFAAYHAYLRPVFSDATYGPSSTRAPPRSDLCWRPRHAPPVPLPTYGHPTPASRNLIDFDVPTYADVVCRSADPTPKIFPEHVCRASVPYSRLVAAPLARDPPPSSADAMDARVHHKSREHRRSWYDNVGDGDGLGVVDAPPSIVGVASVADRVAAPSEEAIVLPPPMPFQSEYPALPASVAAVPAFAPPRHRRQASDGATRVPRVDVVAAAPASSTDRPNVAVPSEVASVSGKHRLSAEEAAENARDTPRRGSSGSRHERSPSSGSSRRASSSDCWNCWACTYLNRPERDICEMCSRSRRRGAESSPLTSGGHECQQCTLVNEKGAVRCEACGLSLENSPTYV